MQLRNANALNCRAIGRRESRRNEKRLVVIDVNGHDTIQIRPKIYVTLTIDHRGLDGYTANRFLSTWVETIETWPTKD